MIVCHCEVVSDRDVRAAIAGGAADLDEVTDRCGATSACGGCIPAVEDLLTEAAMAMSDLHLLRAVQAGRRATVAA